MDISIYISDLLYKHDCVIIPGFGGFICNYQPAQRNRKLHTISPPSKAISFNINLQSNDGLLINYIAVSENISFEKAQHLISAWLNSSKTLLKNNEELILRNIGVLYPGNEGSLQFVLDESVNYLKSSFGLKTITVIPLYKAKEIDLPQKVERKIHVSKNMWKLAASVFLLAATVTLLKLMLTGVEIKPLVLDEAGVFNFITHISPPERQMKPIPIEVTNASSVYDSINSKFPIGHASSQSTTGGQIPNSMPGGRQGQVWQAGKFQFQNSTQQSAFRYYIIVGAFTENKNVETAHAHLLRQHPASEILIDKSHHLTRVGYATGNDYTEAKEILRQEHSENASAWIMEK